VREEGGGGGEEEGSGLGSGGEGNKKCSSRQEVPTSPFETIFRSYPIRYVGGVSGHKGGEALIVGPWITRRGPPNPSDDREKSSVWTSWRSVPQDPKNP
jgi:hypothetical protein